MVQDRKCFICNKEDRLIYLVKENEYICTICYEFEYKEK